MCPPPAEPELQLQPVRHTYAVAQKLPSGRWHVLGEVDLLIDGQDSAWVAPSPRLTITDRILDLIADALRPMGIVWMRGWGPGQNGRVITANGPMVVFPTEPLFLDEGD